MFADWPDRSKDLVAAVECGEQAGVEQLVELLRGGGVVAGQEADQGGHARPRGARTAPQVVVQQLRHKVLATFKF